MEIKIMTDPVFVLWPAFQRKQREPGSICETQEEIVSKTVRMSATTSLQKMNFFQSAIEFWVSMIEPQKI
jgi:hypothetical protein